MGVGGQRHAPAALPPGMTRYSLYRRLGGPQVRSGRVRIISTPPGFDPRTAHSIASRYTDWAIPARIYILGTWLMHGRCNILKCYLLVKNGKIIDSITESKIVFLKQLILIYLLTAIGLPPGDRCTIYIYTQTIHRMTQNKQYIEQHKNFGRVRAVPLESVLKLN
jgi:hypothetical protein